jgi:predicted phosphohydrolase
MPDPIRFVCIADTHTLHRQLDPMPDGDVLLVAGDFCGRGREHEVEDFDSWLAVQPYRIKIVVAGNHDTIFESKPRSARRLLAHAKYLQDDETTIRPTLLGRSYTEGWAIRIYGSPWQPKFYDWAFNLPRGGEELRRRWREIPTGVDVLVTHTPPCEVMDHDSRGGRSGCELLRDELVRIRPRLHVFGHLHGTHGIVERSGTIYVNASIADDRYEVHRKPIVIELPVAEVT